MKIISIFLVLFGLMFAGCQIESNATPQSSTGVKKATAKVVTQSNGLTVEQNNIKKRIETENNPGTIKHLYIMSAYSGQVIVYSTVDGKVTSSGKRLTPYKSASNGDIRGSDDGFKVQIGGKSVWTQEVLQDDGTYGSSIPYLYWWDSKGIYHQHYVSGGQIVHISETPLPVKSVTINMEMATTKRTNKTPRVATR